MQTVFYNQFFCICEAGAKNYLHLPLPSFRVLCRANRNSCLASTPLCRQTKGVGDCKIDLEVSISTGVSGDPPLAHTEPDFVTFTQLRRHSRPIPGQSCACQTEPARKQPCVRCSLLSSSSSSSPSSQLTQPVKSPGQLLPLPASSILVNLHPPHLHRPSP